jgi:hypothetical protein
VHYKLENAEGIFVYMPSEFSQLKSDVLDERYDRDVTYYHNKIYGSTYIIKSEAIQSTLLRIIYEF